MEFANLHHHTTFSFGDGFGTPAQHAQRAAELGYRAITATEHGNVSSHFQLEKAAKKAGIKAIYGVEAYCGPVSIETRSQWKHHLTILAATDEGYRNLNRIVTQSYRDFHYHPTVGGRSLADHSEGLVVLSGCSGSQLACALLGGKGTPEHIDDPDFGAAEAVMERYFATFGDSYFLEVQPFFELPRSCAMNSAYAKLSKQTGIPLVVTHDVHYPEMADAEMQAVLHAVHRGRASVDDAMREWNYDVPLTLPATDDELAERLIQTGLSRFEACSAIAQSSVIAEMCNVTLPKADRLRYPIREEDMEPWV
jgi:DNA polymerase III subunit alpha